VAGLEALGAESASHRYPGVGHDSWTQTYDNHRTLDWPSSPIAAPTDTRSQPLGGSRVTGDGSGAVIFDLYER